MNKAAVAKRLEVEEVERLVAKLVQLRATAASAETRAQQVQQELAELTQDLRDRREAVDRKARQLVRLRGEVDRVAQELAAATAEYEMADAKVARDQAAADMLHRKSEELHREAMRLAKQWRQVRAELDQAMQEEQQAWSKLRDLKQETPQLSREALGEEALSPPAILQELEATGEMDEEEGFEYQGPRVAPEDTGYATVGGDYGTGGPELTVSQSFREKQPQWGRSGGMETGGGGFDVPRPSTEWAASEVGVGYTTPRQPTIPEGGRASGYSEGGTTSGGGMTTGGGGITSSGGGMATGGGGITSTGGGMAGRGAVSEAGIATGGGGTASTGVGMVRPGPLSEGGIGGLAASDAVEGSATAANPAAHTSTRAQSEFSSHRLGDDEVGTPAGHTLA